MRRLFAAGAALLAFPLGIAPAHADDDPLTLSADLRLRGTAVDGQFRPAIADSDAVLLMRLNVFGEYHAGPVRIGAEIQDARAYFERKRGSVSNNEVDTFEPIQAYLGADLGSGLSAEVGRFTMDQGSRRLISRPQWRNTVNAFTGGRLDWKSAAGDKATAFWTMPQTRLPDDLDAVHDNRFALDREQTERQFFGATATKAGVLGGTVEVYGYRLVEEDAPNLATRNRRLMTSGLRLFRAPKAGQFDHDVEGAWQTGTTRLSTAATDRTDHPVSAWLLHAALGRTFAATWQPRIAVSFDYASGAKRGASYRRFDTLYGDTVFEFGPSDLYGAVTRSNLVSAEMRTEVKPDARTEGYVAVRPLWLASATDAFANTGVVDVRGESGHYAGTQIDFRVRYFLVPKRVRISVGAAMLVKGGFLHDAANAPAAGDTHYGFGEVIFSL